MVAGIVTTARGVSLNIDELISKGSKPLVPDAKSTQENTTYVPEVQEPQIRGFVPSAGSSVAPSTPVVDTEPTAAVKVPNNKSMSDATKVVLQKSKSTKKQTPVLDNTTDDDELGSLVAKLNKK